MRQSSLVSIYQCCAAVCLAVVVTTASAGEGPQRVPWRGPHYPRTFVTHRGVTYFAASDTGLIEEPPGSLGRELWRSDGTRAGTRMVKDINPGAWDSSPSDLIVFADAVYFSAVDRERGCALYRTDGTPAGTEAVYWFAVECGLFRQPSELTRVGDHLFFAADDGVHGRELWRSDGTAAGTRMVRNIETTPFEFGGDLSSDPRQLTNVNGVLLFTVRLERSAFTTELWRSDGTEAGTYLLKDVETFPLDYRRAAFAKIGRLALFGVKAPTTFELWRSDGTADGTYSIGAYRLPVPYRLRTAVLKNELYFSTQPSPPLSFSLWKTDGSAAGTVPIIEDVPLHVPVPLMHAPDQLTASGGLVYFTAHTAANGPVLWATDGTAEGTRQVVDLNPAQPDTKYQAVRLADFHGTLFFLGTDARGCGLWKTRGTAATTELIEDLNPDDRHCTSPLELPFGLQDPLVSTGSRLWFGYDDGAHDSYATYVSDGTAAGTYVLNDVDAPPCAGDCDGSGVVTISEIVRGIGIALGAAPVEDCARVDLDDNGRVVIGELIGAIRTALQGCGLG